MSVIVAVIFMFPGVKAGRNLRCDVACRLGLRPSRHPARNKRAIEPAWLQRDRRNLSSSCSSRCTSMQEIQDLKIEMEFCVLYVLLTAPSCFSSNFVRYNLLQPWGFRLCLCLCWPCLETIQTAFLCTFFLYSLKQQLLICFKQKIRKPSYSKPGILQTKKIVFIVTWNVLFFSIHTHPHFRINIRDK